MAETKKKKAAPKKKATAKKKPAEKKKVESAAVVPAQVNDEEPSISAELAASMDLLQRNLVDFVIDVLPGMMQDDQWEKVPVTTKWTIVKDILPYILAKVQSTDMTPIDDTASSQLKQLSAGLIKK